MHLGEELLDHGFSRSCQSACTNYIPTSSIGKFWLLHVFLNIWYDLPFPSYSGGHEVVLYSALHLHFHDTGPLDILLERDCSGLSPFFYWVACLFLIGL